MQNRREADFGAEVLGVARNLLERLGRGLEQKAVDDLLVLVGNGGDRLRQREDHVKVLDRQQIGLARLQPSACGRALAGRTMSVAAARIGDLLVPTLAAAPDVASERRRAAGLDRCHDATLATIEVAGIGLAIGFTVAAEDIRYLKGGTSHARWLSPTACIPPEAASPAPRASNARAGSSLRLWLWSPH
jgi:hypothetical protein